MYSLLSVPLILTKHLLRTFKVLVMICFRLCDGLIVTSFTKNEKQRRLFEKNLAKSLDQYKKYKNLFRLEEKFNGNVFVSKSYILSAYFRSKHEDDS